MSLRELVKGIEPKGIFVSSVSPDAFEIAVATILSQNTSDRNALKAFEDLKGRLNGRITPKGVLSLSIDELESLISSSGLKKGKAASIVNLAVVTLSKWGGDLAKVLEEGEPRRALMEVKGIGPKTADVILLHLGYKETFAIDRHIDRVVKRFGIVDHKSGYEFIRLKLMGIFPPEERLSAHKSLILIGREHCRPRNPSCSSCPLGKECRKSVLTF